MENAGKAEHTINQKLNFIKFPLNTVKYYELGKSCDWLKTILLELNEKADDLTPEENLAQTDITCDLEIKKTFKQQYGDMVFIKGHLSANFKTQCVRTLENMDDSLELPLNACFIDKRFEALEEFSEQLEIFEENQLFDLYFFEKGIVDISEMIHEQIYLNINQYPIKDSEAPLVWDKTQSDLKN